MIATATVRRSTCFFTGSASVFGTRYTREPFRTVAHSHTAEAALKRNEVSTYYLTHSILTAPSGACPADVPRGPKHLKLFSGAKLHQLCHLTLTSKTISPGTLFTLSRRHTHTCNQQNGSVVTLPSKWAFVCVYQPLRPGGLKP